MLVAWCAATAIGRAATLPQTLAPPAPFPLVLGSFLEREFVAPGVTRGRYHLETSAGPMEIAFVTVDPREPSLHLAPVLARDRVISNAETISSMAARTNAVAGINADYFDIGNTNTPLGIVVSGEGLVRTPSTRVALALARDRSVRFETYRFAGSAQDGANHIAIAAINEMPQQSGASLITPTFGVAPAVAGGMIAELTPIAPATSGAVPSGRYRVTQIDLGVAPTHPIFALALGATALAGLTPQPDVGDLIDVSVDTDPPLNDIVGAVGGGPALLTGGVPVDDPLSPGYATRTRRIPIAAVARERDGTLVFFTVDGRHPARSIGVNRAEAIALAQAFGATDAMQFDSGGSATLVARTLGEARASVQNEPSDGVERPVADGLFVYSDAPVGPPARLVVRPARIVALAGATIPLQATIVDAAGHALGPARGAWHLDGAGTAIDPQGVLHVALAPRSEDLHIERDGVRAEVPLDVVSAVAKIAIVPDRPNPDPGEAVQFHAIAFDSAGRTIDVGDALNWSALRGTIDRAGTFRAGNADGFVTAAIGAARSSAVVHVGRHLEMPPWFDETHRSAWHFSSVPPSGPGNIRFLGAATLELTYDFSQTTRAAYANAAFTLGDATAISCAIDGDANGAGLRLALTDRYGERAALTFARTIDWTGTQRREARIPTALAPPLALQSIYVIGSLGATPLRTAGTVGIRDCQLTVPGSTGRVP